MKRLLDKLKKILPPKEEVTKRVGVTLRCLNYWLSGKRPLSLATLGDLLHLSGVEDPMDWLHRASSPVDLARLLAGPPSAEADIARGLPLAISRVVLAPGAFEAVKAAKAAATLEGSPGDFAALEKIRSAGQALALIEPLDLLLKSSPRQVRRLAYHLATEVAPRLPTGGAHVFCAAAGVYASAWRFVGRPADAAAVLRQIMPMAERVEDLGLLARLHRRAAIVLADQIQVEAALAVSVEALAMAMRAGEYQMLPRILVDLGMFLSLSHKDQESIAVLNQALASLPEEDHARRCAAYFSLGVAHGSLAQHSAAALAFSQAESMTSESQIHSRACLHYQSAQARLAAGEHEDALAAYRRSAELFSSVKPLTQAYVSVDLAILLLDLGRLDEARQTAARIVFILQSLVGQTPGVELVLEAARALAISAEELAPKIARRLRCHARALAQARP